MRRVAALLVVLCASAAAQVSAVDTVPLVGYARLAPMLRPSGDTLLVVNFWATWCAPCVEELPAFLAAADSMRGRPVKFLLVSLDLERDHDALPRFLRAHAIALPVVHLVEPRPDAWIPKIDTAWTGSIPATLFVRGGRTTFAERPWLAPELMRAIRDQLHTNQ